MRSWAELHLRVQSSPNKRHQSWLEARGGEVSLRTEPAEASAVNKPIPKGALPPSLLEFFRTLGPGLITGASDDDPANLLPLSFSESCRLIATA
jgi:hypothetical protein